LADFDTWLQAQPPLGTLASAEGPDLSTLLREFIALRQEINLLTRAARTQQEQNGTALQELSSALQTLRERTDAEPEPEPVNEDAMPPHVKQLWEARDALGRADREIRKSREGLEPLLMDLAGDPEAEEPPLPELPPAAVVPFWVRWLGHRGPDLAAWNQVRDAFVLARAERAKRVEATTQTRQAAVTRIRQILTSLVEGYGMSLQRIDRLFAAYALEPIPTEGQRFDPELMEALEAVSGSGRPAGEVIEEVRRGYRQRGRVLRFALVRVARAE